MKIENEFDFDFTSFDLLVDVDNEWFDGESYQIKIKGKIRNIDKYIVNKNNLILFIDENKKEATILSLNKNKSTNSYKKSSEMIF